MERSGWAEVLAIATGIMLVPAIGVASSTFVPLGLLLTVLGLGLFAWLVWTADGTARWSWTVDLWVGMKLAKYQVYLFAGYLLVEASVWLEFTRWRPLVWIVDHRTPVLLTLLVLVCGTAIALAVIAFVKDEHEVFSLLVTSLAQLLSIVLLLPRFIRPTAIAIAKPAAIVAFPLGAIVLWWRDSSACRSMVVGTLALAVASQGFVAAIGATALQDEPARSQAVMDSLRQTAATLPVATEQAREAWDPWISRFEGRNCVTPDTCERLLTEVTAPSGQGSEQMFDRSAQDAARIQENTSRLSTELQAPMEKAIFVRDHAYSLMGYLYTGVAGALNHTVHLTQAPGGMPGALNQVSMALLTGQPDCIDRAGRNVSHVAADLDQLEASKDRVGGNVVGVLLTAPLRLSPIVLDLHTIREAFATHLPNQLTLASNISEPSGPDVTDDRVRWSIPYEIPPGFSVVDLRGEAYTRNGTIPLNASLEGPKNRTPQAMTASFSQDLGVNATGVEGAWLLLEVRKDQATYPVPIILAGDLEPLGCTAAREG